MLRRMSVILKYRGREVSDQDLAGIRQLIADHPTLSRRALSKELCLAWNWRQANGALRDMVCRGLMLALHRAGHIERPPVRRVMPNPLARRRQPALVAIDQTPITGPLAPLQPLVVAQVRRTAEESLCNSLIQQHHYLGYTQPVGEHLKYLVRSRQGWPMACLAWSSAPRHLGGRDRFIGWSPAVRRQNIHLIAYNLRFLILPWVQVPHLASHILGRMARHVPRDWHTLYGHSVYFLETFIDPTRFRGTCYRAANWQFLGLTTGRGKDAPTKRPNRSIKQILGYGLGPDFRRHLLKVS